MTGLQTVLRSQSHEKTGVFLPVHIEEDWLEPSLADDLLTFAIASESRFESAPVIYSGEKLVNPEMYHASELQDMSSFTQIMWARVSEALPRLQEKLGMTQGQLRAGRPILTAYGDGAHFRTHIDTHILANKSVVNSPGTRVMTVIVYLHAHPRRFEGGDLVMHQLGGAEVMKIAPSHNRLVAFPAFAPHEVSKVSCPGAVFANRRFAVNIPVYR